MSCLFGWLPVFVWTVDGLMAVITDGRYVYAVITDMFVAAVTMGTAFGPLKAYGYFSV